MSDKLRILGNYLIKFHDYLSKGCFYAGGLMIFFMSLMISYDVAMRYFFIRPTSWATDFGKYIICYSTFMAAGWILKLDGHVKITILSERLGIKMRLLLNTLSSMIGAVACFIIMWQGFVDSWDLYRRNVLIIRPVIVPKWLIIWIIPFGILLLCIYFTRNVFLFLSEFRSKFMIKEKET